MAEMPSYSPPRRQGEMPTLTTSLKQLFVTSQLPNHDAGYLQGVAIGFESTLKAVTQGRASPAKTRLQHP